MNNMIYFLCFFIGLIMAIVLAYMILPKLNQSFVEYILVGGDIFLLLYLIAAIPLIWIGIYSVIYNLGVVLILLLVVDTLLFLLEYRFRWKDIFKIKIRKSDLWFVILAVFVGLFAIKTSENFLSEGDSGSYFQHTLLMLEGNYDSRYSLNEASNESIVLVNAAKRLVPENGVFLEVENGSYSLHAIGTWCVYPALFGKLFGVYQCNKALILLFVCAFLNFLCFLRRISLNKDTLVLFGVLFATSPLLIATEIEMLSEIALLFLFSCAIYFLSYYNENSMVSYVFSGFSLGIVGYIHILAFIYIPIAMLLFTIIILNSEKKLKFFLVNIIQGLGFGGSLWYCYHISPIYMDAQYRVLPVLSNIFSPIQIFIIIDVCICVLLCFDYIVVKKNIRLKFLEMKSNSFHYLIFMFLLVILFCQRYFGFLMETGKVLVPNDPGNTWSQRATYVGKGIIALQYLGVTNLFRATGIVGMAAFCFVTFFKKEWSKLERFICFTTLCFMAVLLYRVSDIPRNYYASRYYAPLLVPLILLLISISIKNKKIIFTLAVLAFVINLQYFPSLMNGGTKYGQYDLLRYVTENIKPHSIVLIDEDDTVMCNLASVLRVYNDNDCYEIGSMNKVLEKYKEDRSIVILKSEEISPKDQDNIEILERFDSNYKVQGYLGNSGKAQYAKENYETEKEIHIYVLEQ